MNIQKALPLALAVFLAGCGASSTSQTESVSSSTDTSQTTTDTSSDEVKDDDIDMEATSVTSSKINLSDYQGNVEITKGGTYTLSGSLEGILIVNAKGQDVTLVMDGVSITSLDGPAIYVRKASNVTLELQGNSSLTSPSAFSYDTLNACVYSKSDLEIKGDGSLSISTGEGHGIKAKDTFTMDGGNVTITAAQDGIHINEDAAFSSGTLSITAGDEGIQSEMGISIKGGTYSITSDGDAIRAETTLDIQDGDFTLNTQNEGLESKDVLEVSGGNFTINAADDGINAANSLTISGGNLTVVSSGNDAVDSNGTLTISGGSITAVGAKSPEQAFDVDNTPFVISGGDIFGLGSSVVSPTQTSQPVILIGGSGTVSSVEIQENGSTILSWNVPSYSGQNSANLTLSSPKLKTGSTYDIYINGNLAQTVTLSSDVTTIGTISSMGGGMMGGNMQGGGMKGQGMRQ